MRGVQFIIIILFLLIVLLFIKNSNSGVKYVVSDIDGRKYLVRDLEDKQKAANILSRIRKNIFTLVDHLVSNTSPNSEMGDHVSQLNRKIRNVIINESEEDSVYTSYSVNKGEQIVFCLRSKRHPDELHNLNLVMYVALHELAHVACPEYGHTPLFKKIFAYIAEEAVKIGIYRKLPFNQDPTEYCGLIIRESII